MTLARISITIPQPLVAAADRLAAGLQRSRSWVVAEAVRRYTERAQDEHAQTPGSLPRVSTREPGYRPGLDEQRRARLEADLQLTPEGRVREAETRGRLGESGRGWGWQRLLVFDSYEEYLAWKRWEDVSPR